MFWLNMATAVSLGWPSAAAPPESDLIRRVDPIEYKVQWNGTIGEGRGTGALRSGSDRTLAFYTPYLKDGAYSEIDESHLDELLPSLRIGNQHAPRRATSDH